MPSIWLNLYICTYSCALIDAHQLSPSHIGQLSRSEIDPVLRISPCLLNYWDYITLSRFAYLQILHFCRFPFLYISIFRLTFTAHFDMHLCWYPNFTTSWLVSYPPKVQAFIPTKLYWIQYSWIQYTYCTLDWYTLPVHMYCMNRVLQCLSSYGCAITVL